MKEPFSEFKSLITATERYIQELSKSHGVEHLSGPQGWTVMFLKDNQGKEIFIKDIEKRLAFIMLVKVWQHHLLLSIKMEAAKVH